MSIAKEDEILEYLSDIMRRESYDDEDKIKFSDSFKAAELLGKHYGLFSEKRGGETGDVVIIDNIPKGEENGA